VRVTADRIGSSLQRDNRETPHQQTFAGLSWAPLLGGSALAASGLALGIGRDSWLGRVAGAGLAAGGGFLIYRGVTANGDTRQHDALITRAVTISKPPDEVYRFWKQLDNLPRFMKHLKQVRRIDDRRSHWVATAPLGRSIEWDAELLEDVENRRLTWRSLPGSSVDHRGSVEFKRAPGNRGTELHVRLEFHRPGGRVGELMAMMFFEHPEQQIREDLRRFKALVETGELPTTEGQPNGRRSLKIRAMQPFDHEMFGNRRLNERTAV
jgi:uncharacterized membrane protein